MLLFVESRHDGQVVMMEEIRENEVRIWYFVLLSVFIFSAYEFVLYFEQLVTAKDKYSNVPTLIDEDVYGASPQISHNSNYKQWTW